MNIVRREKQLKEIDVIVEDYNICDKCDKRIKKDSSWDVFNCEFVHKTGEVYPEGGSGEEQTMELCQDCAKEFITLLHTNGYRVNHSDWEC